jgi:hypothetical protein
MLDFIRAGGFPMLFVILFGLIALVAAALFVWRPEARKLDTIQALGRATLFSAVTGVAADLAAVGYHVPASPEWAHSPDLPLIVMVGFAESMSPAILGFSFLSLVWMLLAVGHRRLAHRTP